MPDLDDELYLVEGPGIHLPALMILWSSSPQIAKSRAHASGKFKDSVRYEHLRVSKLPVTEEIVYFDDGDY